MWVHVSLNEATANAKAFHSLMRAERLSSVPRWPGHRERAFLAARDSQSGIEREIVVG